MRCRTETLAIVREFTFFLLERQMVLKLFALSFYTNCFVLIISEFLEYQKYGECSDYYRLSCLRQILFLMHSLLVLMKLSIYISGLSHEKLYYSSYSEKTKYELVCNNIRVVICFIILTDLTKLSVKFCVIKVFKFWERSQWMKE